VASSRTPGESSGQVGGNGAHLPGQLVRVPYYRCDVVDCGDGLLEELSADAAGQRAAARCAQTKSWMLRDRIFLRYRAG
jgi:hypothetical protein